MTPLQRLANEAIPGFDSLAGMAAIACVMYKQLSLDAIDGLSSLGVLVRSQLPLRSEGAGWGAHRTGSLTHTA